MAEIDEDRIRQRAYQIWERKGQPDGEHEQHWAEAIGELMGEDRLSQGAGTSGMSTPLHPGGTLPAGGADTVGSIGTGGGATGNTVTGSQAGRDSG